MIGQEPRCPHCEFINPVGIDTCERCGTLLTAYAGRTEPSAPNEAILRKLRAVSVRPSIVNAMAIFCALAALFGPFGTVLKQFFGRAQLNTENTNYIGSAIGAAGVFLMAIFMIPLGIAMLWMAWQIWTQRHWAWTGALALLGAIGLLTWFGFVVGWFVARLVIIGALVAFSVAWFQPANKAWYGVD